MDGFGDGTQELETLKGPVVQGVARSMEAKALEDGLLAVNGKVSRVLGDDKFGTQAEGGQAALERAGGSGGDQRRLVAIIFKTKFGANGDQFDKPTGLVVELFGTLLTDLLRRSFSVGG